MKMMILLALINRVLTRAIRRLTLGGVPELFDATYYLNTYSGVRRRGIDPYLHYVLIGRGKGHDPAEDFNTKFYVQQSGRTKQNPVRHYAQHGVKLGFDPNPSFSTRAYLDKHPDVREGEHNPLAHYRMHGRAEGREVLPSFFPSAFTRQAETGELTPHTGTSADVSVGIAPPPFLEWRAQEDVTLKIALNGKEIEALACALQWQRSAPSDTFANIRLKIALKAPRRPSTPTAHLVLNNCLRSEDGETIWIRYCELRLVDLQPTPPKVITFAPSGSLKFESPDVRL